MSDRLRSPTEIKTVMAELARNRENSLSQPKKGSSRWRTKLALGSLVAFLSLNPTQLTANIRFNDSSQNNQLTPPSPHYFINMPYFLDTDDPQRWDQSVALLGSPSVIAPLDVSPDPYEKSGNWYTDRLVDPDNPQHPIQGKNKGTGVQEALIFRGKGVEGNAYFLTEFQLTGNFDSLSGGIFLDNSSTIPNKRFVIEGNRQGLIYYGLEQYPSGIVRYAIPKTRFYLNPTPLNSNLITYRTGAFITDKGTKLRPITPDGELLDQVNLPWPIYEDHIQDQMGFNMINYGAFEKPGSQTKILKLLDYFKLIANPK